MTGIEGDLSSFGDAELAALKIVVDRETERRETARKAAVEQLNIYERLERVGAIQCVVEYSGQGDSGEVESIRAFRIGLNPEVEPIERLAELEVTLDDDLSQAIDEFVCNLLSAEGIDWYNNEGGYGTARIDVPGRKTSVDHYHRVESSEYVPFEVSA